MAPCLYDGQSYVYDSDGNVVSSESLANTKAQFAYTNDYLSRSLSPTGSSYTYTYNGTTHDLMQAISNAGQRVDYTYNETGGATQMKVSAFDLGTAATGTPFYIVNAKTGMALTAGRLRKCHHRSGAHRPAQSLPLPWVYV